MYNNSNKAKKKMPNIMGTEPEDINARLNSMYGNLTAQTPEEVKIRWRARKFTGPPINQLERESEQERNRQLDKWFQDRRARRTQNKEVPKGPGINEGQAINKVRLPRNCNHSSVIFQCGDCKMSYRGRIAETGQKDASSAIQESKMTWEKFVPLPDDTDEEL